MNWDTAFIAISGVAGAAASLADALCASLAFAFAALRYSGTRSLEEKSPLGGLGNFFRERPEKTGSAIGTARRILSALSIFFFYSSIIGLVERLGIEPSAEAKIYSLALAFFIQLVPIRILVLIPLANYGAKFPRKTIGKFAKLFALLYPVARIADLVASKCARKIFGKRSFECAALDYIDVELRLRAENSDADSISPYAGKIVKNALRLGELDVSDVMLPRSRVVYLDTNDPIEENMSKARSHKFSRFPVCAGDLDRCLGIVHMKDIFGREPKSNDEILSLLRGAMKVRENENLETALAKMLKYNIQMALVEDEFGGIIGALTLDAALGELVGEIRDGDSSKRECEVRSIGKNLYRISGRASLRKVEDFLNLDFKNDEVSTFGGLITQHIGRFPEKGERIRFESPKMTVIVTDAFSKGVGECTLCLDETPPEHKS